MHFCWGIDAFDLGDRASRARGSTFGAGGFIVWSEGIDVRARGAFDWGHVTDDLFATGLSSPYQRSVNSRVNGSGSSR